jgi:translation elongation factor P/translation initiation factor 5A
VVEVTPKNDDIAESEGYSKKKYWVSKKTYTVRKGLYYDLDGKEFKVLTTKDVKTFGGGKARAMHMEMLNKTNGRKSVFITKELKVDGKGVKDAFFEQSSLEK